MEKQQQRKSLKLEVTKIENWKQ